MSDTKVRSYHTSIVLSTLKNIPFFQTPFPDCKQIPVRAEVAALTPVFRS